MDLGIAGRKAIVCASSRGLGRACARALADAGCDVIINGRDRERVLATAAELHQATGAKITPVVADVASPDGQKALFDACPEPDILVNNNGGPPFRDFRELDRQKMLDGVVANMVVAIELVQKAIEPKIVAQPVAGAQPDEVKPLVHEDARKLGARAGDHHAPLPQKRSGMHRAARVVQSRHALNPNRSTRRGRQAAEQGRHAASQPGSPGGAITRAAVGVECFMLLTLFRLKHAGRHSTLPTMEQMRIEAAAGATPNVRILPPDWALHPHHHVRFPEHCT